MVLLELRLGIQASSCVGPGKSKFPYELRARAGGWFEYAEYIMRNAGLEETQAGIKIAGRNVNNLRYTDDTTFIAENE